MIKQLNNISTPKGRKVFSRRILFFSFFILAVIALALGLWLKRTMDQEIKQDNIDHGERKRRCTEPPQKV